MNDEKKSESIGDELRELAQSFSSLGRSLFKGGHAVSVELLRALRGIVDEARKEIDRLNAEKKP